MVAIFMARFDGTDIVQKVHRIVELNTDYPSSGEDTYDLRLALINDYVDAWGGEEGTLWNELWVLASFTSSSATSYTLSAVSPAITTMKFPGGFVELVDSNGGSTYWEVIKPEEVRLRTNNSTAWDYQYTNEQTRWCYFLGDPQAGFTLYFNPNFIPGTGTIKFPYYKKATRLADAGDKPQMSDPEFLVHSVASDVLAQEDPGEADKHLQIAHSKLKSMKTQNMMAPHWQINRVQDRSGHLSGSGFGK